MPPKRKAVKAEVEAVATNSEAEPVKQKRGRKAKEDKVEETNGNGVDHDNQDEVPEVPKRSGRAKKAVVAASEAVVKEAKAAKPKRAPKKKAAKKEESPVPEEDAESEENDEPVEEPKPTKKTKKPAAEKPAKKTKKAAADSSESEAPKKKPEVEAKETKAAEKKTKRGAKAKKNTEYNEEEEGPPVKKAKKVLLNKTATNWESLDFTCSKKNKYEVSHNLIISTWNIGGLKSWASKGCLEYLNHENPDIFCVQETKCNESKLPEEVKNLKLYKQYWCASKKEGYAGVGIFTVKEPKSVTYGIEDEDQDEDGRCITAEYDGFYLVNVYVPNAGRKLVTLDKRLDWNDSFKKYILKLDEKKPVIICGDMNVSHQEVDLARPKNNTKNAGFTKEERDGMTDFLKAGFVDVYRHMYPEEKDVYSFWTYMSNARSKNIGWRLDYFLVSERLVKGSCDVKYRTEVLGSDHCPVTLFINA